MTGDPSEGDPRRRAGEHGVDVVCIGNAIMDYLVLAERDVLTSLGLAPGGMTLVDIPTTIRVGEVVGASTQVSGGTVTNTAVGIASLGGNPVFIGAVAADDIGDRYAADLEASNVRAVLERFPADPADPDAATGRCFVLVTPDAERTMVTALGVGARLDRSGIVADELAAARLVYFDGYLLDLPDAEAIVERIFEATRASGGAVAVSLADAMVVERHRSMLARLVERVDIVLANEAEVLAFTGETDVSAAVEVIRRPGLLVVATRGAAGALVAADEEIVAVPAAPVQRVVDVTGAGDLFAAGVCYGYTHGLDVATSARLGALAASEVISHLGARPESSLADLALRASLV